jgi:hypothetical protein
MSAGRGDTDEEEFRWLWCPWKNQERVSRFSILYGDYFFLLI